MELKILFILEKQKHASLNMIHHVNCKWRTSHLCGPVSMFKKCGYSFSNECLYPWVKLYNLLHANSGN